MARRRQSRAKTSGAAFNSITGDGLVNFRLRARVVSSGRKNTQLTVELASLSESFQAGKFDLEILDV